MKILLGNSLATSIVDYFNQRAASDTVDILPADLKRFPSTEAFSEIQDDIKDEPIVVVQSLGASGDHSTNDYAMQLLLTIRTLKRYGAGPVWVVSPYAGYGRADKPRADHMDAVACDDFAAMLKEAGASGFTTIEMHSDRGFDFYRTHFGQGNVFNLDPTKLYAEYLKGKKLANMIVGGPDAGANERADELAKALGTDRYYVKKKRDKVNVSQSKIVEFDGDVQGHQAIIADDMIDTGGTAATCASCLRDNGATSVFMAAAHGVFSKSAMERLYAAHAPQGGRSFSEVIITDTINREEELRRWEETYPNFEGFIKILSVREMLYTHITKTVRAHPKMRV
jgi:ribose-phosphate pyrophosphokinase